MLSRVIWPHHDLEKVLVALRKNLNKFKRICIQAVNYPNIVDDIRELVARVKEACDLPVSVSCQPLGVNDIQNLARAGVERICVALDAATQEVFERVKGDGYTWEGHIEALEHAQTIFGDRVTTHLIVGFGESEEEMARTIQFLHDKGITIGLFAFTPIAGTPISGHSRPDIGSYRKVQLTRFLIINGMSRVNRMRFDGGRIVGFGVGRDVINRIVGSGKPFCTSGCPGCNRPFYNESPRGPIYNYPRKPTSKEIAAIRGQLGNL